MNTPLVSSQRVAEIVTDLKSDDPDRREQGSDDLSLVYGDLLTQWILKKLGEKEIKPYYAEYIRSMSLNTVLKKISEFVWREDKPEGLYKWICAIAGNHVRNLYKKLNPKVQKLYPDGQPLISLNYLLDKMGGDYLSEANSFFGQADIHAPPEEQLIHEEFIVYLVSLHKRTLKQLSPLHQVIVLEYHLNGSSSLKQIASRSTYSYSHVRNEATEAIMKYRAYFCETLMEEKHNCSEQSDYVYLLEQMINAKPVARRSVTA